MDVVVEVSPPIAEASPEPAESPQAGVRAEVDSTVLSSVDHVSTFSSTHAAATSHSLFPAEYTQFRPPLPIIWSFAAGLVLCLAVFIRARRRRSSSGSTILLLGASDAGKTALYSALVWDNALPSYTSMQSNTTTLKVPKTPGETRSWQLVDVPGHPRIRDEFKTFIPNTKAVIFVVDASTIARNGPSVAEHLHLVLHAITTLPPSQPPPHVLILAHKADMLQKSSGSSSSSLAISRVRTVLERELQKRRTSGVGVPQLGEKDDETDAMLGGLDCIGKDGENFRFESWDAGEITLLSSYVKVSRPGETEQANAGLSDLWTWLESTL